MTARDDAEAQRETEREGYGRAVELSGAARQALQNSAIVAYFDQVETNLIDAMLVCEDPTSLERLRVGANAVRKLKQFLRDALPAGEYAARMLERMSQEDNR